MIRIVIMFMAGFLFFVGCNKPKKGEDIPFSLENKLMLIEKRIERLEEKFYGVDSVRNNCLGDCSYKYPGIRKEIDLLLEHLNLNVIENESPPQPKWKLNKTIIDGVTK